MEEHLLLSHRPRYLQSSLFANGKAKIVVQDFEILVTINKLRVKESTFVLPVADKLEVKVQHWLHRRIQL